jgi:transposase-like protein
LICSGAAGGFVIIDGRVCKPSPKDAVVNSIHAQAERDNKGDDVALVENDNNTKKKKKKKRKDRSEENSVAMPTHQPKKKRRKDPTGQLTTREKQIIENSTSHVLEGHAAQTCADAACAAPGNAPTDDHQLAEPPAPPEDDKEEARAWRGSLKRTDVKSGRFTTAEKQALRAAVLEFAASKGFSTEDFSWLVVPGQGKRQVEGKETMGIWKEVAKALPNRTIKAVAAAGLRLFHPDAHRGRWTPEEDDRLLDMVQERGNKWSEIAPVLGRTPDACRDRWKEVKLGAEKAKGPWTVEEEQRLKEAVEDYLQTRKEIEERETGSIGSGSTRSPASFSRRHVRDDVDWDVISRRVKTRSGLQCLLKWYDQLCPSMVERGEWGVGDDRRMLRALWAAQPRGEFAVNWAGLVGERTASQARRRWRLMIKAVPDCREKEFGELLESLVDKYMPHLRQHDGAAAGGA